MRENRQRRWPWFVLVVGVVVWASWSWLTSAVVGFFGAGLETQDQKSSVGSFFIAIAGLFIGIASLAATIGSWRWPRKGTPASLAPVPPPGQVTAPGMISLDVPQAGSAERTWGRDTLIRELIRACRRGAGQPRRVHVLHGMGGAGKTTIATHVARQAHRRGIKVWWIPVTTEKDFHHRLWLLAEALGATPQELVHDWAHHAPDVLWSRLDSLTGRWLLIFDNADDVDLLTPAGDSVADGRGWIRSPAGRRGMLLITSRHGDPATWGESCRLHRVGMLSDVDGACLLTGLAGPGAGTLRQAERLAARLGGLPLALTLAGRHLADAGRNPVPDAVRTYPAYQQALDRAGLTAVFPVPPAGASLTDAQSRAIITHTWELSLTQLRDRGLEPAIILLRLLSLFAAAPVPYRLLHPATIMASPLFPDAGPPEASAVQLQTWLNGLATLSLITRDNGPAEATSVRLHPLVREAGRHHLRTEHLPALYHLAARLLGHATGRAGTPSDPRTWTAWQLLSPHPLAVLADIAAHTDPEATGQAADAALLVTAYLSAVGHYRAARAQTETILSICRPILGEEHPTILEARGRRASCTGQAGDAAAARDQLDALLPVRERVLGPEHPDTLTTRHHRAQWTGAAGDAATARDQLDALLPVREHVLGPEHPDTLTTRHHLAEWIGYAGDRPAARERLSELLPIREAVLGPEHPDTLTTRHSLASATEDASAEREVLADLLPIRERVLGADHPDTLMTRHNLAHPAELKGKKWRDQAAAARDRFAELLTVTRRVHGPDHPHTLVNRISLAYWTGHAGDPAAARDQFGDLLPIAERMHGPEHLITRIVRNNLAACTGEAGDPGAARDQFTALLAVNEKLLGAEHPDTLTTRHHRAWWTGEAGDAAAARNEYAALLSVRTRLLGDKHPKTRATQRLLDDWRFRSGARDDYWSYPLGQ